MNITATELDEFIDAKRKSNYFNIAIALFVYFSAIFVIVLVNDQTYGLTDGMILVIFIGFVIFGLFNSSRFTIIVGLEGDPNSTSEKIKNSITKKDKKIYYYSIIAIFFVLLILLWRIDVDYITIGFWCNGLIAFSLIMGISDNNARINRLLEKSKYWTMRPSY